MSVSVLSNVINGEGYETKVYKIQKNSDVKILSSKDSKMSFNDVSSVKKNENMELKTYVLKIKNNIEQEFRLVCDEKTEIYCKKNGETGYFPVADVDLSCIIYDYTNRISVVLKKFELNNKTNKEDFVNITGNFDGFYCSNILIRTV